jgi:hypothetical protein
MEDFAVRWENFETTYGQELESWEVPVMRQHYAETYRRYVGVHPGRRDELWQQLLGVLEAEFDVEGTDGDGDHQQVQENGSRELSGESVFD